MAAGPASAALRHPPLAGGGPGPAGRAGASRRVQPQCGLRRDERGTGLIGTWAGFVIFLALLLFAVQVMFNLWSTSAVTAAASDAARKVATADDPSSRSVQRQAEDDARRLLGKYATERM